jgi:hypothetical protein
MFWKDMEATFVQADWSAIFATARSFLGIGLDILRTIAR